VTALLGRSLVGPVLAAVRFVVLSGVLCAAICRPAEAAPNPTSEQLKEARAHFERGKALYTVGQYADAIREFQAGYVIVPRPQFLLNLGQAYRKLGELVRAKEMYQKFLDEAPSAPEREQVTALIADLDREIAAAAAAAAETKRAARAEKERLARERAAKAAESAVVTTPPPPTDHAPRRRRLWIIPVVVGAAAVIGVAVGVGVWAGTRAPDGPTCTDPGVIGCIDASSQALSLTF
jgi:hypothetical protein